MSSTSTNPRILVAGIGNIFLGDDGFGSEAARRLTQQAWPADVRVVDFGIRGIDLLYALLENYELTILIDATERDGLPGTLYTIEPNLAELAAGEPGEALLEAHTMDPLRVLRAAAALGAEFRRIVLVACEPGDLGGEEGRLGLSEPVAAAVDEACRMVTCLANEFLTAPPVVVAATTS